MPHFYTDTAPDLPPRGSKVTWMHHRIERQGRRISTRSGVALEHDRVSGMTRVRCEDTGKTEWLPTRALKRA